VDLGFSGVNVLVVNAGSSSLKLALLADHDQILLSTDLPALTGGADDSVLCDELDRAGEIDAVGHRIVHGGQEFVAPIVIDDQVEARLRALVDLAPLHQPTSLRALDLIRGALPDVPHVGCFDTAFHAGMPEEPATYALPEEWRTRWGLRRFGFHGLSHAYATSRVAQLAGKAPEDMRIVSCHLGAGASLAAVKHGVSVDTTMGFTPLEGLVMATRSGSVDPGLILWLEQHAKIPRSELAETLERRSGLLGLAGSADMRAVLDAERAGNQRAAVAVGVYLHRLRASIASMAAAMNGLDAILFTGGVGENSPEIRIRAGAGLGFLGIELDAERNASAELDAEIGAASSAVRAFAVRAQEDLQIANDVRVTLQRAPFSPELLDASDSG
jgi:acetate kinase